MSAPDSVAGREFGRTWWGRAWLDALEQRAQLDPDRLPRGREYAQSGAVGELTLAPGEVERLLYDLRDAEVDVVTLGQYLQPARRNLRVAEYVTPAQFDAYREFGLSLGFKMVFSGPLVRSSYMADVVNRQAVGAEESV